MSSNLYSDRLGAISDAQFTAAASRLGLGAFVSASPISSGMHGQNVFMTTEAGEFVLRGAPHWVKGPTETTYRRDDRVQFTAEAFFVGQLHEHTRAPVPWPCLHDQASDIFGWPYLVMPRMPGSCFNERTILKALGPEDRRDVAAATGVVLAELQRLTSSFSGGFDVDTVMLTSDAAGNTERVIAETRQAAAAAEANGVMTLADMDWIEAVARGVQRVGERPNSFVHGDYKLDNMTVANEGGRWRVSGIFDFHTARFGDGAFDLVHQACGYLDTEPDLARVFVDAYRANVRNDADLQPWMPLYVVRNRVGLWHFFASADARPDWSLGKTFRSWAEPYLSRMLSLL
jgi:hygromycin-B 7''-O-kinase